MITWQDPVALALATLLIVLGLRWRHVLIKRGQAPHCTQCTADASAPAPRKAQPDRALDARKAQPDRAFDARARPTRIDVKQLRIGRGRPRLRS